VADLLRKGWRRSIIRHSSSDGLSALDIPAALTLTLSSRCNAAGVDGIEVARRLRSRKQQYAVVYADRARFVSDIVARSTWRGRLHCEAVFVRGIGCPLRSAARRAYSASGAHAGSGPSDSSGKPIRFLVEANIHLTVTEFRLLEFSHAPRRTRVNPARTCRAVWWDFEDVGDNTLERIISLLATKLTKDNRRKLIHTSVASYSLREDMRRSLSIGVKLKQPGMRLYGGALCPLCILAFYSMRQSIHSRLTTLQDV